MFRMVSKLIGQFWNGRLNFRAVLFRMVSKLQAVTLTMNTCFRAVLFRMVSKPAIVSLVKVDVLELCCFEWFQN